MSEQLNTQSQQLCQQLESRSAELDILFSRTPNGATIVDFGADRVGTTAAGVELARVCVAGLAEIEIVPKSFPDLRLDVVTVETSQPLSACIASQYAGWPFSTENYFAMCSGPARLLRGEEEILKRYQLSSEEELAVGVFESSRIPSADDLNNFAGQCKIPVENVTICIAKTSSIAAMVQIVSRSVETAMHKLFELGIDLNAVKRGKGTAPLPPQTDDDFQAMGWTNDAILYGGDVELWVEGLDIANVVESIPSCSSSQFGRPFKEIFEECGRDFYQVDRMLFAPAKITLTSLETGQSVTAGSLRTDLLSSSFES